MKKGFTLVEIIISIGLIVIIGTISIFSFNLIKKKSVMNKLEKMSDEILNAVNVYVETNSEVKNTLYTKKNGIKIPLITLENSGLVDFNDLNDEDIEDEFVVAMLGTGGEDDDHCANTYTAKSWNIKDGETIYICEKADGTSNLVQVAGDADNLSKATREIYYFDGLNSNNYVKLKGTEDKYRILFIDKDDSISLYGQYNFSSIFDGLKDVLTGETDNFGYIASSGNKIYSGNVIESSSDVSEYYCTHNNKVLSFKASYTSMKFTKAVITEEDEVFLTLADWKNTAYCYNGYAITLIDITNSPVGVRKTYSKIKLKPCVKIVSGTGSFDNPYIIEPKNCS